MIAKLIMFVSSLVAGTSLLFGSASGLSMPILQASTPTASQGERASRSGGGQQYGLPPQVDRSPVGRHLGWLNGASRRKILRPPGPVDEMVRYGLILAAVSATGLSPVDVLSALDNGSSVADIAGSAGLSVEDVLNLYDDTVEYFFKRSVENGRLPEDLVQSRISWYQEVGRQMVEQPGLKPPFPGLHELHQAIILAAVQVGDLNRDQVREGLKNCQSLEDILVENGHTGQEAVDYAAERIDGLLDRGVKAGKLTDAQAEGWLASITSALEEMVKTPGLHIAGQQCSS